MREELEACYGCGALVPPARGPVHRYLGASPSCWAIYGEILEREYGDHRYWRVHRLTVDAYAAQHPGEPSRQTIGSIGVHLIRLQLFMERGLTDEDANAAMLRASQNKRDFVWLEPPESPHWITLLHVREARDPAEHEGRVREWAESVWEAWSEHHETVRQWAAVAFRA